MVLSNDSSVLSKPKIFIYFFVNLYILEDGFTIIINDKINSVETLV